MKIHVRRRHIKDGSRNDCYNCPVALAIKEMCGVKVRVYYHHLYMGEMFKTPAAARRFIARFDAGKPVKPFAFVLK